MWPGDGDGAGPVPGDGDGSGRRLLPGRPPHTGAGAAAAIRMRRPWRPHEPGGSNGHDHGHDQLDGTVEQQVLVAGGDPEVEAAARALLTALDPAIRQLAYDLAEQAAAEVTAQLPSHEVDVVLTDGEPTLRVRPVEGGEAASAGESLDARITLRLPPTLKELVESAAETGASRSTPGSSRPSPPGRGRAAAALPPRHRDDRNMREECFPVDRHPLSVLPASAGRCPDRRRDAGEVSSPSTVAPPR